jgi:hypothetical protein
VAGSGTVPPLYGMLTDGYDATWIVGVDALTGS